MLYHMNYMLTNQLQRNRNISILVLLLLSFFIHACQEKSKPSKIKPVDEEVSLEIMRFEKDLFYMEQNDMDASLKKLAEKYPGFYEVYFEQMMGFGNSKNPDFKFIVKDFINNKDFKLLVADCDTIYNANRTEKMKEEIAEVFKRYKAVYPNDTIPKVCTFVSGFANGIVNTDGYIGIGLDLFLGANYKFYPSLDLPEYLIRRYTPEHLVPTFVKGLATSKYEEVNTTVFLDRMLYEGKLIYFAKQFLPDYTDSLIIGYTSAQMKWSIENENNIFQLLVSEDLFSTDVLKYRKYTDEAPYTVNLTADSAPRIAWFIGLKIIEKYMEENPTISLDELMKEKDSQKILRLSKYKAK